MSIVARCGSVALLLGLFIGTAALAQTAPEPSGSWTDPPVRGAAGPQTPAVKPSEPKPSEPKPDDVKSPGPAAQALAATPSKAAAAKSAPALRQPVQQQRAFADRRYPVPIRRFAQRPRGLAAPVARALSPWSDRLQLAARQEREARRSARRAAAIVARRDPPTVAARARRLATNDARRFHRDDSDAPEPPFYARRAGWGGLVGDDRAYRVAQARAAGYRVMRLRTYAYPDGSQVQRLMPLDAGDLD